MHINTKTLVLGAALALGACTHAADVSRPLTEVADKNAKFNVTPAVEAGAAKSNVNWAA